MRACLHACVKEEEEQDGGGGERCRKFVDPTSDDTDVSMLFSSGPETPHLMLKKVIKKYTRKHIWRCGVCSSNEEDGVQLQ